MRLPEEKQNLKEAKDKYKASKVKMWAWIWESLSQSSTRHIEETRKDEYEETRDEFDQENCSSLLKLRTSLS